MYDRDPVERVNPGRMAQEWIEEGFATVRVDERRKLLLAEHELLRRGQLLQQRKEVEGLHPVGIAQDIAPLGGGLRLGLAAIAVLEREVVG